MLHRVIEICGLEDCSDLVALATPAQLARVFDLDLWHAARAGRDEHFDASRFGVWLEVLLAAGPEVAAGKLAGMDVDLVAAGFAQHVRVFDEAAVAPFPATDGEMSPGLSPGGDGPECGIGGYRVRARRSDAWDAAIAALAALGTHHPAFFGAVMESCRRLSNSAPEIDGLHEILQSPAQAMFDVASDREERREGQGYVTPAQARAFLDMARRLTLGRDGASPAPNALVRAHFRAIASLEAPADPTSSPDAAAGVAALLGVLHDAGIVTPGPARGLLADPQSRMRFTLLHAQMAAVHDRDATAFSARTGELAFLANTLMAGGSLQARPFTIREASDAAAAVCNLGLENWPGASGTPDDLLVTEDLTSVFPIGWTVLHDEVCMHAAAELIDALKVVRCEDAAIQSELRALRLAMTKQMRAGTPWLAREALETIAILDMPVWAALDSLIAECPVLHAAIGASLSAGTRDVSPSAFEFISENRQIAVIRQFLEKLPTLLAC